MSQRPDRPERISALYLLVPQAEPLLDAVRGRPGVALLEPAHISLGYPWLAADEALTRLDEVRAVAADIGPIDLVLEGPHRFPEDNRGRVVIHLRPVDDTVVRELAHRLDADLRTTHLSLARVGRSGDRDAVEAALAAYLPLTARIESLEVTVRERPGDWSRAALVDL